MLHICQKGYEKSLQDELERRALAVEVVGTGWVASSEALVDELCFSHLSFHATHTLGEDSLNAQAGAVVDYFLSAVRDVRFEAEWPFVVRVEDESDGLVRRGKNLEKEVRRRLKKRAGRMERLATRSMKKGSGTQQGLFLHLADDHVMAATSAWAGGQRRMADDPLAPSRSYLKVEEAYGILGVEPQAGETVVDLGAAPGGWSYSAAKRGARVTAVDNGPMKKGAADHPQIAHVRGDAFKFQPQAEESYDWLFCDLVEEPHHVMRLIRRWLDEKWCRRFVVNLKFGRAYAIELIEEVRGSSGLAPCCKSLMARHLFHDREECTLLGEI